MMGQYRCVVDQWLHEIGRAPLLLCASVELPTGVSHSEIQNYIISKERQRTEDRGEGNKAEPKALGGDAGEEVSHGAAKTNDMEVAG